MSKCEPCRRGAHAECYWPNTLQCDCNHPQDGKPAEAEPASEAERLEAFLALLMTDGLPLIMPLLRKRLDQNLKASRLTYPPDCFRVPGARLQELMRQAGANYSAMLEFVSPDADYILPLHNLILLLEPCTAALLQVSRSIPDA